MHANRSEPALHAAKQILDYFLRNPGAADSLTGIARWRLIEDFVERSVDSTQIALNWLVEQGYMQVLTGTGEPIFRLNAKKRRAAEGFLHPAGKTRKRRK